MARVITLSASTNVIVTPTSRSGPLTSSTTSPTTGSLTLPTSGTSARSSAYGRIKTTGHPTIRREPFRIRHAVPYPDYSWILTDMSKGWSSYNGLLTKLEKRFSNGVTLRANYTWSHDIDLGEGDEGPYSGIRIGDLWQHGLRHSPAVCDRLWLRAALWERQTIWFGVIGRVDKVIGGWRVTGITTFETRPVCADQFAQQLGQ